MFYQNPNQYVLSCQWMAYDRAEGEGIYKGHMWLTSTVVGVHKVDLTACQLKPCSTRENITPLTDFHENYLAYAGGVNGTIVYIYNIDSEEDVYHFDAGSKVSVLAFSPDGSLIVTGHEDGAVRKWDAAAGQSLGQIGCGSGAIQILSFTPDGTRLYSAGSDDIGRVWQIK